MSTKKKVGVDKEFLLNPENSHIFLLKNDGNTEFMWMLIFKEKTIEGMESSLLNNSVVFAETAEEERALEKARREFKEAARALQEKQEALQEKQEALEKVQKRRKISLNE